MLHAEQKTKSPVHPRQPVIAACLTLRHSGKLYDWYANHACSIQPQVLDADEIINDKAAVRHVCSATGRGPDANLHECKTKEETDAMKAVFLLTINASKGIIPDLTARGLDLETEKGKWKAEFDDGDSEDLVKFVLDAMSDYDYLLSRRTYLGQVDSLQKQD